MDISKIAKYLFVSSILVLTTFQSVNSHPGRTASDGCHYCRTNCSYWGVPWNERHCHGNLKDENKDSIIHSHSPSTHTHDSPLEKVRSID